MKQRVITAFALLALLIVVVWQIYTPFFTVVIAAFAAIAADEIMKCAKISNKFITIFGTVFAFFVPFFMNASSLEPLVKTEEWFLVINAVPRVIYIAVFVIACFLPDCSSNVPQVYNLNVFFLSKFNNGSSVVTCCSYVTIRA